MFVAVVIRYEMFTHVCFSRHINIVTLLINASFNNRLPIQLKLQWNNVILSYTKLCLTPYILNCMYENNCTIAIVDYATYYVNIHNKFNISVTHPFTYIRTHLS